MAASDLTLEPPRSKGIADRLLSMFSQVNAGEGVVAVLLGVNVFLLMFGYYLLKPVREALIISQSGAAVKSYSSAAQAALLLLVVPVFGILASRVNRVKLITGVTLFFAANLAVFALLGQAGARLGVAFFIWLGIYNVLVPAQMWGFNNDLFTVDQGKRLFPVIGIGASLGAWLGSVFAKQVFRSMGPYRLMLLAAAMLILCVLIVRWVNRRESSSAGQKKNQVAEKPLGKEGGFQLVLQNRYLFLIAMLVMLLNVVNTTGEFLLDSLVEQEALKTEGAGEATLAAREKFIGVFKADFFSWVNLTGFLMQLFLVSRIFKYVGVGRAVFILPMLALCGYSFMIAMPMLAIVRIAKIMENSTDYSLQSTIRHALFLPTSREAKYKAKAAVETFFWRAGDMLQAGVVLLGTSLGFATGNFAMMNLGFTLIWLTVAFGIYREHKKLTQEA